MVKFNETTSKYTESEVKTNEAITQKEESIQQREQEIKLLKGQLEQYLVNIASFEQEKKNLNNKLDESTRKLNEATESVSSQRELAERREHEVKELKEKIEKFDSENKLEEIKNLHSQINDLKQNEAQHEHASRESISQKDAEIKSLREKCEQIENANKHLNEQLKETSADKSQLVELTAKVQELEKKLNVSSNIINSLKTTKTTESTPDESARLKELIEENEDLKSKNFRLKSGLAVTEKSISQLEGVIKSRETSVFEEISNLKDKIQQLEAEKKTVEESGNKMIKKISKELKKEIDLRKELQKNADLAKVNGETNGTNVEAHANGTNGTETNGTNGHHEATNFDSKVIDLMKVITF
jgi:DNA repair exonuclease SbcCD ATPase subunit